MDFETFMIWFMVIGLGGAFIYGVFFSGARVMPWWWNYIESAIFLFAFGVLGYRWLSGLENTIVWLFGSDDEDDSEDYDEL